LVFETELPTDWAAGFNLGTKRTSYDCESCDINQFTITRKTLQNCPLCIALVVLVTAFFFFLYDVQLLP